MLLWIGEALSTLGSQMSGLAYPLLVLAVTGSPAKAGLVGFARMLPWALFVLPAGTLVDRVNRRHVMIAADVGRLIALTTIVAALLLDRLAFVHVLAVAFVEGALFIFFTLAESGALSRVVPAAQLPAAVAQNDARTFAALVAGPPLGGLLYAVGRALPFLADAASYLASLLAVLLIRTPFQEERAREPLRLRAEMTEGLRWLWSQRFLRDAALLFTLSNFAGSATYLMFVVVAHEQGLSAVAIGLGTAAFGVSGLAGALASPRLQRILTPRAVVRLNPWMTAAMLAVFAVRPNAWLLAALFVPGAFYVPTLNAVVIGYRLALVPDRLQGRVNGVAKMIAMAGTPLGPVAAGAALELASARTAALALAAVSVAGGLFAFWSAGIRAAPTRDSLVSGRDPVPAA